MDFVTPKYLAGVHKISSWKNIVGVTEKFSSHIYISIPKQETETDVSIVKFDSFSVYVPFWFLKINSLMAETIKKYSPKRNFYKQIAELDNNLFIFENWKYLSCSESFSWKSDL